MANGMTIENMPSIYEMTVTVPTENGTENASLSEIYLESGNEKDIVNVNAFSTQISSFYNRIEFENRQKIKNLYNVELLKRSNESKSVTIINQTNVQNIIPTPTKEFVQTTVKFSYPSVTKTSNFQTNIITNIKSNVRFVYPSVKWKVMYGNY